MVDLGHSRSTVLALPEHERRARLEAIRDLAQSVSDDGAVEIRYRLQVWSARPA